MSSSGIPAVGDLAWGSHFCQFYRDKQDLADTLVPYFIAGLQNHEACVWITSAPFNADQARDAMRAAMAGFDDRTSSGQILICGVEEWYGRHGQAGIDGILQVWFDRERAALAQGYSGLRITGNAFWVQRGNWDAFMDYEARINACLRQHRIIALCSYCLEQCRAEDVLDVIRNHLFALTRRHHHWELIEASSLKIAKDELQKLNADLEHRVEDRTAQLQESLRSRDRFLAMLGHELRNPLAPITNAMQILQIPQVPPELARTSREMMARQVRHLTRIVDDLLDVSRIVENRIPLHKERIDLVEIVRTAAADLRALAAAKALTLTVLLPSSPIYTLADATRISQAISNLLDNAIKFTDSAGTITLQLQHVADTAPLALLTVRDTGVGIDPAFLPKLFEPFVQADRSLDRSGGGLGLGLAIVKGIVELHGGTIHATSPGPGRGAEFSIRLPLVATTANAATPVAPGIMIAHQPRVS